MLNEMVQLIEKDNRLTQELREALKSAEAILHNGQAGARVLGMHVLGARCDRQELCGGSETGKGTQVPAASSI